MKLFLHLVCLAALSLTFPSLTSAQTLLVNMEPTDVAWGSFVCNEKIERTGEKADNLIVDYGGGNNFLYDGGRKIVKEILKDYKFPEGKDYTPKNADVFAVGGEFVTGVGILTRQFNMYYDMTYKIPNKAKKFQARLLASDFAQHYTIPGATINQQAFFTVSIDENEVFRHGIQRMNLSQGSGEELATINVDIPAGAKNIRFYLESSPWGDQGATELIINEGKFIP